MILGEKEVRRVMWEGAKELADFVSIWPALAKEVLFHAR